MSDPGSQRMTVSCKCGHAWAAAFLTGVDVRVWSAHIKTMHCPKCGAGHRKLSLGGVLPVSEEAKTNARRSGCDKERRSAWVRMGDCGLSSMCIADVMVGSPTSESYPHDADDFGRCYRLLKLYPEWRARIKEMSVVSEYWSALVGAWDRIEAAYETDLGGKGNGQTYALMRELLDPLEKRDPSVINLGRGVTLSFGRRL